MGSKMAKILTTWFMGDPLHDSIATDQIHNITRMAHEPRCIIRVIGCYKHLGSKFLLCLFGFLKQFCPEVQKNDKKIQNKNKQS